VQSMKHHADQIEQAFGSVQISLIISEASTESRVSSLDEKVEALQKKVSQVMGCPVEAWRTFREGRMIAAVEMCTDTLVILKRDRVDLLKVMKKPLLNCIELQIMHTQTRIKKLAVYSLNSEESINLASIPIPALKESLLLHSGLHALTHYSAEDLANAFMTAWKAMKVTPVGGEALRRAVQKNVQMLVFGWALLGTGKTELCDLFELRIRELAGGEGEIWIIDKTLIKALEMVPNLSQTLAKRIRNSALDVFKEWAQSTWDANLSSSKINGLAAFRTLTAFQSTYDYLITTDPLKVSIMLISRHLICRSVLKLFVF